MDDHMSVDDRTMDDITVDDVEVDDVPMGAFIEVIANDRLGHKVRVKCSTDDTIGDLKKLIAAQTGTDWTKITLKRGYDIFKSHLTLSDYEISDGMSLDLY